MRRKLQFFSRQEIICVVLNESCRSLSSLSHLHQNRRKSGDLVIPLRSESDAFRHQILGSKTRKLTKAEQVLECIGKRRAPVLPDELFESHLVSCLLAYRIEIIGRHGILLAVFLHLCVDLIIRHLRRTVRNFSDSPVLDLPSIPDLCLEAIAVGHRDITHVVAERCDAQVVRKSHRLRYLSEAPDSVQYILVSVISRNNFMLNVQPCKDITEFSVSMRRLIQIHEVHIDRIVWKSLICLCVQMKQRLSQFLKALNPHLGRRKRMHPCDHAGAVIIIHYFTNILHAGF